MIPTPTRLYSTLPIRPWKVHPERTRARRPGEQPAHVLVIHTSEQNSNGTETAENLARMIGSPASRTPDGTIVNQASYHWAVDTDSIAQLVDPTAIAYHAPPNWRGESICLTGRAGRDWTNPAADDQLDLAARLAAIRLLILGWPAEVLTSAELQAGANGMCGHVGISAAFRKTDHTDPGVTFPWSAFIGAIEHHQHNLVTQAPGDTEMTTARRVRIRGTHNVFLIGTGPPVHLTPELHATYADIALVVIEPHDQFAKTLFHQTGLNLGDLVGSGGQ